MKKVLIITYYWPPAGGPGSQRAVKFAKYLPQFGWKPVILTVRKGEFPYYDSSLITDIPKDLVVYQTRTIEPFLFYKKITGLNSDEPLPVAQLMQRKTSFKNTIFNWIRANVFVPDARIGWIPFGRRVVKILLKNHKIDIIFTTSPPHSLQLIGSYIKKKFGIPWVADFRDPWTDIQYYKIANRNYFVRKLDRHFEKIVIESADHITAVSPGLINGFRKKVLGHKEDKYTVLTNGYDPSDYQSNTSEVGRVFQILHIGNLNVSQNPLGFWEALSLWFRGNSEYRSLVKIKFIGRVHPSHLNTIENYGFEDVTDIQSYKPHQQIIEEIQKSAILLSVVPDVSDNDGIVLSKNFEYIGSGRPILVFGPPKSDIANIFAHFSNSIVCDYLDKEKCINFINVTFQDWKKNRLRFLPMQVREQFSRQAIAGKLSTIFNRYN